MTNVVDINCTTGEVVERPMTPEEISEMESAAIEAEAQRADAEAQEQALAELKASARQKLIAGQPLTAEEAETIVL